MQAAAGPGPTESWYSGQLHSESSSRSRGRKWLLVHVLEVLDGDLRVLKAQWALSLIPIMAMSESVRTAESLSCSWTSHDRCWSVAAAGVRVSESSILVLALPVPSSDVPSAASG
jgi:hypothetical protein